MSTGQETRYAVQGQASAEYPFVIWDDKYHRFVTAHATVEEAEESTDRLNSLHEHKEEEARTAGNGNGNANKPDSLSALREFELARGLGFDKYDEFVSWKERHPDTYERWLSVRCGRTLRAMTEQPSHAS